MRMTRKPVDDVALWMDRIRDSVLHHSGKGLSVCMITDHEPIRVDDGSGSVILLPGRLTYTIEVAAPLVVIPQPNS